MGALLSFLGGGVLRAIWGEAAGFISKWQDSKIEADATKIQAIELEAAKNAASMNMHFVTREEYRIDQVEIKQCLNQIFTLLRDMSTKLDDKVSRHECDIKMDKLHQ